MNSNTKPYQYNETFINIINNELGMKNIMEILDSNRKYSVDFIFTQIIKISIIRYNTYILPNRLKEYMNLLSQTSISKSYLKIVIKRYIISEDDDYDKFIQRYVVIGNDIPLNIKSLDVICD
jgi:hypothetical protein